MCAYVCVLVGEELWTAGPSVFDVGETSLWPVCVCAGGGRLVRRSISILAALVIVRQDASRRVSPLCTADHVPAVGSCVAHRCSCVHTTPGAVAKHSAAKFAGASCSLSKACARIRGRGQAELHGNASSDLSSSKRSRPRPWEVLRLCESPGKHDKYCNPLFKKRLRSP